ncbi:MAG: response regulator transcription factor [Firmicutes bacterium]|nr:response regulator transcription factor [Alicyclobacillaceae bacterium]MCL6498146.1 response regulator transcription factor [Bacillota bacterium]
MNEREESQKIRVAIVDDHEMVRTGVANLLSSHPDLELVGGAGSVNEALSLLERTPVDVLLLDIRLPDGSGIDLCRTIQQRGLPTHVIILTSFGDEALLFQALEAGASGYLLKNARGRTMIEAIRTVAKNGSILDPAVAGRAMQRLRQPQSEADPFDELTPQERRILRLIAEGKTNREIGAAIYLSEATVKHYVSNIFSKLNISRRAEAAAIVAKRQGG